MQSSIRQTLSSLARGSFDALRSRMVGEMGGSQADPTPASLSDLTAFRLSAMRERIMQFQRTNAAQSATPGSSSTAAAAGTAAGPSNPDPLPAEPLGVSNSVNLGSGPQVVPVSVPRGPTVDSTTTSRPVPQAPSPGSSEAVIRITFSPRITSALNAPELGRVSPPGQYLISTAQSESRSRVPPLLTMNYHYDIGEGYYRTRITTNTNNNNSEAGPSNNNPNPIILDPVPGPSRDINLGRNDAYRRMFREYHILPDHRGMAEAEHSRFCPFSGRDGNMVRPPPRMRCVAEMGEDPVLSGTAMIKLRNALIIIECCLIFI